MGTPTTNSFSDFRTRRVRDSNNLIIQIRQFSVRAEIGSVCKIINISRDTTTKLIVSSWTSHDTVTQEDLDSIS